MTAAPAVAEDPIVSYGTSDFVRLIPGMHPQRWKRKIAPKLVEAGVLHRVGRRWHGRRSAIDAALLGQIAPIVEARKIRGR